MRSPRPYSSASKAPACFDGTSTKYPTILLYFIFNAETMNVHIVQCDSDITEDTKITSRDDLKAVVKNLKVRGFGATDFRPVFDHVDDMIRSREFSDLKGLIYFTDGYGIYPDNPPRYDCMFVFDNDDEYRPPVPGWAIKVVL